MNPKPLTNILIAFGLLISPLAGFTPHPEQGYSLKLSEPYPADENALNGTVRYVRPGASGDCSSWVNACDLQTALRVAEPGDEIWVQEGLYKPTSGITQARSDPGIG